MAAPWPEDLPCILFNDYAVAPRSPVLEVDHGLAVRRRQVYSDMREQLNVSLVMTATQEPIFREFYNVTLEMGSLPFDAPILFNGTLQTRECKFIGSPPDYTPLGPIAPRTGYVRATATLLTAE